MSGRVAARALGVDWTAFTDRLAADGEFSRLAIGADVRFALATPEEVLVEIAADNAASESRVEPDFTIALDETAWRSLLAAVPSPRTQHVLAHIAPRGSGEVRGNQLAFAQNLHLVRRAIEVLADRKPGEHRPVDLSGVTGRYVRVDVSGWGTCDVYVESAGKGRPVVLLHTAGSDSTQYHGLLSLADNFPNKEFIAFDLPWHGRSGPAHGLGPLEYELTSERYADCIAAVIAALDLDTPPVIVGASMAGGAVLEVAARHPRSIAAAIGCQVGPRVTNRHNAWLRSPQVNQTLFVPEWTFGLMSPYSPKDDRDRVWWGYSQGGYAIYERDITYYTQCWDIDNILPLLNSSTPPIVLMSGAWDYTVPPATTRELASQIPGAVFHRMPELGHFPHAENPKAFATHLAWALHHLSY